MDEFKQFYVFGDFQFISHDSGGRGFYKDLILPMVYFLFNLQRCGFWFDFGLHGFWKRYFGFSDLVNAEFIYFFGERLFFVIFGSDYGRGLPFFGFI